MGNNKKNRKQLIIQIFQLLLFVGLGIFFIWYSVKDLTPENVLVMKESVAQVKNPRSWIFLALSFIVMVLAHYFRALRSVILIEPMQYKVRKSMSFYAVMVCYLSNLAFPRIGEVLRCTFLQRYEKVPFQKALGTVVTERAIDLILWLFLLIIAIFANTSVLSNLIVNKENETLGVWLENTGMSMLTNYKLYLIIAIIAILGILLYTTRRRWSKISFFMKISHFFHGIWQGLISIKDVKHPVRFVIYTLMIWVCFFFGTYFCFLAFDFLKDLGFLPAFSVLAFGSIGFMIAQGGLGAYPLVVAGVMVLYHVNYSAALAAGWVGWTVQTIMVIIVGFVSLVLASLSDRKEQKNGDITIKQDL